MIDNYAIDIACTPFGRYGKVSGRAKQKRLSAITAGQPHLRSKVASVRQTSGVITK